MSKRHIRRLLAMKEEKQKNEEANKNEQDTGSDKEEHSPYCVAKNFFEGLEISSDESISSANQDSASVVSPEEDKYGAKKKMPKKIKKKNAKKGDKKLHELEISSDESISSANQDSASVVSPEEDKYGAKKKMPKKIKKKNAKKGDKKLHEDDEVERSVREVNRILGTPPNVSFEQLSIAKNVITEKEIFSIEPPNIDPNYELAKILQDEKEIKEIRKKGIRRMRHEIGLSPELDEYRYKGFTMNLIETVGDKKIFKFHHTKSYQERVSEFLLQRRGVLHQENRHEKHIFPEHCIEALLENVDVLFYLDESKKAQDILEECIWCMQSVGEPTFNFVDGNSRIEYKYVENRPFHIAILKYLHVLTHKGFHRTALELAKVLINMDPSDPLAVIFIIDTLALRSFEFQWLVDLIELWREKRQVQRLFNMRFSGSLALFHIAYEKKDFVGIEKATEALMETMRNFPLVARKIMELTNMKVEDYIKNHDIFKQQPPLMMVDDFKDLMTLYCRLIAPLWKVTHVWDWFIKTARKVIDLYDSDPDDGKKEKFMSAKQKFEQLYRVLPPHMIRHIYTIKSMATLISDGRMPYTYPSVSCNPYPAHISSVDTNRYYDSWTTKYESSFTNES